MHARVHAQQIKEMGSYDTVPYLREWVEDAYVWESQLPMEIWGGFLCLYLQCVSDHLQQKMELVFQLELKFGVNIECPILSCPLLSPAEGAMISVPPKTVAGLFLCASCMTFFSKRFAERIKDEKGSFTCPMCRSENRGCNVNLITPRKGELGGALLYVMDSYIVIPTRGIKASPSLLISRFLEIKEKYEEVLLTFLSDEIISARRSLGI